MNTAGPWENNNQVIHFCGCTLDSETQTLQTATDFVRLRSKLWQVLIELVSNSNKLVKRDALIQSIWHGNGYTGEQGITHAICHLRRILKKYNVEAQIITLPKKGYILRVQHKNLATTPIVRSLDLTYENNISNDSNYSFDPNNVNIQYNIQ